MKASKGTLLAKTVSVTCGLMLAHDIGAQTFTTLHSFAAGTTPFDGLVLSSNTLYGTAYADSVFALGTYGMAFTNLHSFTPILFINSINYDGYGPTAGLTLFGTRLYGTTVLAGSLANGTVFAVNTDGTDFTVLHNFNSSSDGDYPNGRLVVSGNMLYGTAVNAGISNAGTVFALGTNGTGFTVLHTFTGGSDGSGPYGTLTLAGNTLYGTTRIGGSDGNGTVFAMNTDGTDFKVLHTFTTPSETNSDGIQPVAGLILSGDTLYGSTASGGSGGSGTLFAMNIDGTGFKTLHSFTALPMQIPVGGPPATNSDGASPHGELILSNNTLYGAASAGGVWAGGTLFAINIDGTGFTVLHTFQGTSDGSRPNGNLILSGNTLYGTTVGTFGEGGAVFSISFSPHPTIVPFDSNVILSWPTNYAGFDYAGYALQSTTDLASRTWTTNFSAPVVMNGQYTVTNSISGKQQFFRLRR